MGAPDRTEGKKSMDASSGENSCTTFTLPVVGADYCEQKPVVWQRAASSTTFDLPDERTISWHEVAAVGKPILGFVLGWAIGVITGMLGLILILSN